MIYFKNLITTQKSLENQKKIPIHDKYITFNNFDKFPVAIFDERLKQAKVATTNDHDSVEQCAIEKERKTEKLQTFDLNYLLDKNFVVDDGF